MSKKANIDSVPIHEDLLSAFDLIKKAGRTIYNNVSTKPLRAYLLSVFDSCVREVKKSAHNYALRDSVVNEKVKRHPIKKLSRDIYNKHSSKKIVFNSMLGLGVLSSLSAIVVISGHGGEAKDIIVDTVESATEFVGITDDKATITTTSIRVANIPSPPATEVIAIPMDTPSSEFEITSTTVIDGKKYKIVPVIPPTATNRPISAIDNPAVAIDPTPGYQAPPLDTPTNTEPTPTTKAPVTTTRPAPTTTRAPATTVAPTTTRVVPTTETPTTIAATTVPPTTEAPPATEAPATTLAPPTSIAAIILG